MKKVQLFLAAIIIVFASCEEKPTPGLGTLNGHECVDLGLSVRWATMNVGANSPEEVGWAFSWGETKVKSNYSSETYFYSHDGSSFLPLANDAAHVHFGGRWRMPTDDEWKELQAYCTWTFAIQNGVPGCLITSMTNNNSIFLPATYQHNGYYWSSSVYDYSSACAFLFRGSYDIQNPTWVETDRYENKRYDGLFIRPVCE